MQKLKKFFSKLWSGIKKVTRVVVDFFKENVWAEVLGIVIAILLFILIVQGIVKAIDKCKNTTQDDSVNRSTTITTAELMEKLNNGDTFVLFLGSNTCSHCKEFYKTVNRYIASGNTVYYVDLADTSDTTLTKYYSEIEERLLNDIPEDRDITSLATPTTVYVLNGEFADAIQGAYGMDGGSNYVVWCDVVEGNYVGKPVYKLS